MNKNGFTLIELLGVITLLGVISLIAFPTVKSIMDDSKQKLYDEQIDLIENSLENFASSNVLLLPEDNNTVTLTLGQLKQGGYIQKKIKNPKTNKCFSNETLLNITKYNETYVYKVKKIIETACELQESEPIITLNGNIIEYVTVGDNYTDLGASAKDANGTDLTSDITTTISGSGTIDTSVTGNYIITYNVTNNGKTVSAIRNVFVEEEKYKNGIMTSNNNCINKGKCTNGTKVNVKVNAIENYDFYVIEDNGSALTLIMDRNLVNKSYWINGSDYTEANTDDGTVCEKTSCNDEGPITVLNSLKKETDDWKNIPEYTYTISDEGPDAKYSDITMLMRARLLTYSEITKLGCTTTGGNCPSYLYTNLSKQNTSTLPSGYWTNAATKDGVHGAWAVAYDGNLSNAYTVYSSAFFGIRPVISLLK